MQRNLRQTIENLRRAEKKATAGTIVTEAAARSLFKLMAYKDEYEVARLYSDANFENTVSSAFEGQPRLTYHLAPPFMGKKKRQFGPWFKAVFCLLAPLKILRGTALDPFGYSRERRTERAMIEEFEQVLDRVSAGLGVSNIGTALNVIQLPLGVRGFGHIKTQAIDLYRRRLAEALAGFGSKQGVATNTVPDQSPM